MSQGIWVSQTSKGKTLIELIDESNRIGRPFIVPVEKREEAKKLFETLRFNVVASDMIPLNRTYPDKRDQKYV